MRILRRVNASGWDEWIKISNLELMLELHITSEATFRNNRNKLIEMGLIQFRAGKKGKPSDYRLNMPGKKDMDFERPEEKHVKNKGYKIDVKTDVNIDVKTDVKTDVKNLCNPLKQCAAQGGKHKTINNKLFIKEKNTKKRKFTSKNFDADQGQLGQGPPENENFGECENQACENIGKETGKTAAAPTEELFERFYQAYPKKKSKGNAAKWFRIHKPDRALVDRMIESLNRQKLTLDWQKEGGKYIPYPASWLNSQGWENEVDPTEIVDLSGDAVSKTLACELYETLENTEFEPTPGNRKLIKSWALDIEQYLSLERTRAREDKVFYAIQGIKNSPKWQKSVVDAKTLVKNIDFIL